MGGVYESLFGLTFQIISPGFSDQFLNAHNAVDTGIGIMLDLEKANEQILYVLQNQHTLKPQIEKIKEIGLSFGGANAALDLMENFYRLNDR
eukprot:UN05406